MSVNVVVRCLAALSALLLAAQCVSAAVVGGPGGGSSCATAGPTVYGNTTVPYQWNDQSVASAGVTACQVWPTSTTLYYNSGTNLVTGITTEYNNQNTATHGDVSSANGNTACNECTFGAMDVQSVIVNYDVASGSVYQVSIDAKTSNAVCSCGTSNPAGQVQTVSVSSTGWIGYFAGYASVQMTAFGAATVSPATATPTAVPAPASTR